MVVTEWWEIRSGFIAADVIKWREPLWRARGPKGRKKQYTGEGFGGQRLVKVGHRVVSAEVIEGPDEDGWVYLLVRQYDNLGYANPERLMKPIKVGERIRRRVGTIMRGDPRRLAWSDEPLRSALVSQYLGNSLHKEWWEAESDDIEAGDLED